MGFGEVIIVGIILLVVVGPRELPKLLKALGKGVTKLRRMSSDLRHQSGIDEIIREEGLREDLDALRSLSRGRAGMVEGLVNAATRPARRPQPQPRNLAPALADLKLPESGKPPDPLQEYPVTGPDHYGALADDAPDEPALAAAVNDEAHKAEATAESAGDVT